MNHSTSRPTKSQQVRLYAVSHMRCVCCEIEGANQPSPTEVHHLVDKGYRKHSGGHDATIPLCGWHHRGLCVLGDSENDMLHYYGPSLALHKRGFVATYGTERELLERVNERLKAAA